MRVAQAKASRGNQRVGPHETGHDDGGASSLDLERLFPRGAEVPTM
jgi:hypothetical protein